MLKVFLVCLFITASAVPKLASAQSLNDVLQGLKIIGETENILRQQQAPAPPPRQIDRAQPPSQSGAAQPSMARSDIREIQSLLAQSGYDPGPIDGLMGQKTRTAIRAFERDNGLSVTGRPSRQLQADLRRAVARIAIPERPATGAVRPSFDCARASTPTEFAICGSTDLAELDQAITRNYAFALESADATTGVAIRNSQKAWLDSRDRCGGDVQCLAISMATRAQGLAAIASSGYGQDTAEAHEPDGETYGAAGPSFAQGPLDAAANEEIFISRFGPGGYIDKKWNAQSVIEAQRDLLASLVAASLLETPQKDTLLDFQRLTERDITEAMRIADVGVSRQVDLLLKKGRIKTMSDLFEVVRLDLNQFEQRRLESALRDKATAAVARSASPSKNVTLICVLDAEGYDFDSRRFPFDQDDVARCFDGEPNAIGTVMGMKVQIPIETDVRPDALPVDERRAEEIVERSGGPRFALAVPVTLRGYVMAQDQKRASLRFVASVTGPIEVRRANELSEVLYRFSDAELRDVADTPHTRRLKDFDRVWWLDTPDEVNVVAARAERIAMHRLDTDDLFATETGLKFAFRTDYAEHLVQGSRRLSDFIRSRNSHLTNLANMLGVPIDAIVEVPLGSVVARSAFDRVILLLPQPTSAYGVDQDLPAYEKRDGGWPFSTVELTVTAERIVTMPDGSERLVLAGYPDRLVVRRSNTRVKWQDAPEIAQIAFSKAKQADYRTVELAWRSDLIFDAAEAAGSTASDIFQRQLDNSRFGGSDAFAKRAAAAELLEAARRRDADIDTHWMRARVKLDPYDFEREGWRIGSLSPALSEETPEADRALRVTLISDTEDHRLFVPALADIAQGLQAAAKTFPDLDALIAFDVTGVDSTYGSDFGRGVNLLYRPSEIIFFDAGEGQTVIDETKVLLRHRFEGPDTGDASRSETHSPPLGTPEPLRIEAGSFSVLGVSLGDAYDAAAEVLAERIGADARYRATVEDRQAFAARDGAVEISAYEPYHNATLLESSERQDMIAIYHEPPLLGGVVTGISRTRLFPGGRGPSWPQLRDQLLKTYDVLTPEDLAGGDEPRMMILWDMPPQIAGQPVDAGESACKRSIAGSISGIATAFALDAQARANDYLRPIDNRAAWFAQDGNAIVPRVAAPMPLPAVFGSRETCPDREVMILVLEYGPDARVREFRQAISNPAAMARVAADRKDQATTAAPSAEAPDFDL